MTHDGHVIRHLMVTLESRGEEVEDSGVTVASG